MSATDILAILPIIIAAASAVAVMVLITFYRDHMLTLLLTIAGLAAAFGALSVASAKIPLHVTTLLIIDGYALFYMGLLFAAGLAVALLSYGYLEGREGDHEEFYLLLLLAVTGSAVLVSAAHFASFFLGLEILSVALYTLIAYLRTSGRGNEAGIKYLVLAAVSASFLLFGMALVYAGSGTMEFAEIAKKAAGNEFSLLLVAGFILIVTGIGFKLALVPFHMWTPDVYEGAPAPVSAFIATVSKGAVLALLLRYFAGLDVRGSQTLFVIFTVASVSSMFVGNLLALLQRNVKRILAYSSIAHLGYLIVAFLSGREMAATAVGYYLVAYFVTMLGAFGVVTVMSGKDRDADSLEDYRGLASRRPWLAGIFTAMLLSLAGIPLTAGFIGKFYVVAAGAGSALWLLVIMLVVNSAIGLFYYLRIVMILFEEEGEPIKGLPPVSFSGGLVLALLTLLLFWFGIYPAHLARLIQAAAAGFI